MACENSHESRDRHSGSIRTLGRVGGAGLHRTLFGVLLGSMLLIGCAAPEPATSRTVARLQLNDYHGFIDDTMTTLREGGYEIATDGLSRSEGRIVSESTTGAQYFEWWRPDGQSGYAVLENSMHTIARRVRVSLTAVTSTQPSDEVDTMVMADESIADAELESDFAPATRGMPIVTGAYVIEVVVDKRRFSSPQRQVTTSSQALGIFSERLPTREGLRNAQRSGDHWVPQGRDALFERYLLEQFLRSSAVRHSEVLQVPLEAEVQDA